jgi:hypothetical protein
MASELIAPIKLGLASKLKNAARRRRMFLRLAQDEIAQQLRSLRDRRGFKTQTEFAKHAHMQQSAVSRIENADYQGWTFKTLLKVANALDARLRVTFEPAEETIWRFERADSANQDSNHESYFSAVAITLTAAENDALRLWNPTLPHPAPSIPQPLAGLLGTPPLVPMTYVGTTALQGEPLSKQ